MTFIVAVDVIVVAFRYEMDDFESEMLAIYREMEPLYTELHAYIRRRLHQVYGDHIDLQGPLPAHLLSDMWGRFWNNLYPVHIYDRLSVGLILLSWHRKDFYTRSQDLSLPLFQLVEPFPGKPAINPTENLKKQNYTGLKMFQTADNFYHDMGMRRVPESFWNDSMLTKPTDGREVRQDPAVKFLHLSMIKGHLSCNRMGLLQWEGFPHSDVH